MKLPIFLIPTIIFLFLVSSTFFVRAYVVVPNTIGIGLQKDFDDYTFLSDDSEKCVMYHLQNAWSTNVTGWLVVGGDLENYFVGNNPKDVFVPSGTFRYNSSCCLLPIFACFKFPYVLNTTSFSGTVSSAYIATGKPSPGISGTGSIVGSSVTYSLTLYIKQVEEINLNAGENKCIEFYQIGEKCFSAPWIIFSDYSENKTIDGHILKFNYKNNLILIICLIGIFSALFFFVVYYLRRRRSRRASLMSEPQVQTQPSASGPTEWKHFQVARTS